MAISIDEDGHGSLEVEYSWNPWVYISVCMCDNNSLSKLNSD